MSRERPLDIALGTCAFKLPVFFPSVSSLKTNLPPEYYVAALTELSAYVGQLLVSAYDVERREAGAREGLLNEIQSARDMGIRVLMDSGNYEGYWCEKAGQWTETDFHQALKRRLCDIAFGFDSHLGRRAGEEYLSDVDRQHERDCSVAEGIEVVPVVHGAAENLPSLCAEVAERLRCQMIAVPERELGDTVTERLRTVAATRKALSGGEHYVALHLLGTGNPTSIALFVWAGADSFDGLEWCQTVVDYDSGGLSHLSHYDFFKGQSAWGESGWPSYAAVLGHNLEFMRGWMNGLRVAVGRDEVERFCTVRLPQRVMSVCAALLSGA